MAKDDEVQFLGVDARYRTFFENRFAEFRCQYRDFHRGRICGDISARRHAERPRANIARRGLLKRDVGQPSAHPWPALKALPSDRFFEFRRSRFLAEHLDGLYALLEIDQDRVGHLARRLGAAKPLQVKLQEGPCLAKTL
jgi:hypothetical protein